MAVRTVSDQPTYDEVRKREIVDAATAQIRAVTIDPAANAGYFMLLPGSKIVATTERRVNIDWDAHGGIVGIELLDVTAPPNHDA